MTRIRAATTDDVATILAIYAHYVLNSVASFEETPPTQAQMSERMAKIFGYGLPFLVLEDESGDVKGYTYAGAYNVRTAYRYCVEDSIYLHPDSIGKGHGAALLSALIAACEARGVRQMLAVISGPLGASARLHESLGFVHAGHVQAIGYKFGAWHDVRYMQRALGPGDSAPPSAKGGIIGV
jgi:L-amino acid N-acyltransferase YncA